VQRIIEAGLPWTDPEFPPVFSSLAKEETATCDTLQFRSIEWKRVSEIFDNPKMFDKGISPDDIS